MDNKSNSIDKLGETLVNCDFNCAGITNDRKGGIPPRGLDIELRTGSKRCIIVGLNPGKISEKQKEFYLKNGLSFSTQKKYFESSNLKEFKYFKRTRELISKFGYDGDILWTELVKCQCSGKNGILPIQTLRICINKYLIKEIEIFDSDIIFALGNNAFDFCALSFPNHFVVGLPHPSGSYGDFFKLKKKVDENTHKYNAEISKLTDSIGNPRAIKLSKI